jgi:vacuolar-type H+-ATPase subunit E/Vma4
VEQTPTSTPVSTAAPQRLSNRLSELKTEVDRVEQDLARDIHTISQMTEPSRMLERIKEGAVRLLSQKRTLYIVGGIVVGFLVVRALFSSSSKAVERYDPKTGVVIRQSRGNSLVVQLLKMAVQTFVLHYARKLLVEYMDRKQTSPKTV